MSAHAEARPNISVVAGDNVGSHAPSPEPEAQPPVPPAPQELEKDLGGPAATSPEPEELVEASGGSVADRMRARFESMSATEEFSVPGWELDDGSPGLILVARAFGDRKGWADGISNEAFIAKSTYQLYYVDDGERVLIEGGWGPKLAEMIGVRAQKATDLVAMVISKPDPDNPKRRIPNIAGIGALATELVAWSRRAVRKSEEDLGE